MVNNELARIVGKENVSHDPETLAQYAADLSFTASQTPAAIVRPADIGELKQVVEWANDKRVALVPVSSGAPHLRGDTVPEVSGAVVVDLRRMNRIIRINAANRVAIVEPGVTFGELQAALAKQGLSAYLPLCPRGGKSVLASVLEREPITMPGVHFDSTDPMLCAEIVFGSGQSMRTGEAAGPDSLEEQWEIGKAQISPFGPTQMDPQRLVSGAQGTIGIVTWMSLKCRFLSQLSRAYLIGSESLEPLIELSYKLTRIRFSGHIFILNALNLACLVDQRAQQIQADSARGPAWVMFASCEGYGVLPEEKVHYLQADLKELARSFGLQVKPSIGDIEAAQVAALLSAPSPEPYWKQRLTGGFDELFFLTTQGQTVEFAALMAAIAREQHYPSNRIGAYIQPVAQGTSCHCEFDFYYDVADSRAAGQTRRIITQAAGQMEARGAFFSRPYRNFQAVAYRRSADTAAMQQKVKAIFDPNGILNPGKLCFRAQ